MSYKTRTQLMEENAALEARMAKMESGLDNQPSGGSLALETGTIEHNNLPERKQIEEALKASEVRYRRLFETAKDGILILDAETGKLIDVNPFLQEMLGYSHEELLGKTLWEIGSFKDVAANQAAFRELQDQEYVRYENLPLETKRHEIREVEFISNVYLVDGRKVIQCNIRDITARRHTEERLRKVNEELLASLAELQRHDSEMKVLNQMNELLQACTTQKEAYRVIGLMAGDLFDGQSGCLATLHTWDQYLETAANWGEEATMDPIFAFEHCWAMRRGKPHEVADPKTGLQCQHFVDQPEMGYFCVPLTVQGETLGLLCLIGSSTGKNEHWEKQQQLAMTLGETIKLSLSNLRLREKLREQATHDPLTGLCNRRYLEENLLRELHHAQRRNSPLCVSMLDLDHFKQFNDTFGHDAGDALLCELGRLLREELRKSDILCRYGGEEFVVVLCDSSLENAWQRMEQLRVLVRDLRIRHGEQQLGMVTVSAGLAGHEHGFTPAELLRAADESLYAAKQAGRDRVVVYDKKLHRRNSHAMGTNSSKTVTHNKLLQEQTEETGKLLSKKQLTSSTEGPSADVEKA